MDEQVLKKVKLALDMAKIKYEICGAYRRKMDATKISMVVEFPAWRAIDALKLLPLRVDVRRKGTKRGWCVIEYVTPVFVMAATPETWGGTTLTLTGNSLFNRFIRARARELGMILKDSGLWLGTDLIAGRTEKQIFDSLGCKYLEPHERTFRSGRDGLMIKVI